MLTARPHRVAHAPAAILLLLLILSGFALEAAGVTQSSLSEVEAVYLFDFGKFVRWPAGADQGPMPLCVAASSSFTAGLQKIVANENIGGRHLEVRPVARAADASGCAILFIEAALHLPADEFLAALADKPTLTVSDMPQFLSRGGMIQFQFVGKRVRFSINLDAVTRAHLTMSSELLKVALTVKGKTPEGGAR